MIDKIYKNPGKKVVDIEGVGLCLLTQEGVSEKTVMDVQEYQDATVLPALISEDAVPGNLVGHCEVIPEEKGAASNPLERVKRIYVRISEGGIEKDISWDEAKTILEG